MIRARAIAGTWERKWLLPHDESEWSLKTSLMLRFLSSISRTRWSFLEANAPVVVSLMVPFVIPIDEMQMKPRLMMAALITGTQTKNLSRSGKGTMFVHFPKTLRARWFEKSADVGPIVRNGSRSPQWWRARWRRQGTVRKYFVNSTDIVTAATTPSGH